MKIETASEGIYLQDYLAGERRTEIRHEYINGITHAMGGASAVHNLIAGNLFAIFRPPAKPHVRFSWRI